MTSETIALADLSLFPANPEQVYESRRSTAAQWSTGRSVEAYLSRDIIMDKFEHAVYGKFITWVLAPRSNPVTLDFLCSCKTFRRSAAVAKRGENGNVQEVTAYAIAGVYTPPQNRRKGYARHMMHLLHWVLAPRSALPASFPEAWGAPPDADMLQSVGVANARFSVLYSDVGKEFYRSCGTGPSLQNGWFVTGNQVTFRSVDGAPVSKTDAQYTRLSQQDVVALYEHDARWLADDLAHTLDTGRTRFTFLPDKGVGAYILWRTMDVTPTMQPVLPSSQWGLAILPPGAGSFKDALEGGRRLTFATWLLDVRSAPRTLGVLRLRADKESVVGLLEHLLIVAREEKCEKIELWWLAPELREVAEAHGWTTEERADHLSAVKWYGQESEDEVEWVNNEKFCWC